MLRRLLWVCMGRYIWKLRCRGFFASLSSYVAGDVRFHSYNKIYGNSIVIDAELGRFTYLAGAAIRNAKLGSFCSVGPGALIGGLGSHPTNWVSTHPAFYSSRKQCGITFSDHDYFEETKPVSVGNDVWIGANAIILDGVSVGNGVIIAAGSVVTCDVDDYSIVGGVPAKLIRKRFCETDIDRLLKLCWWDWNEDELQRNSSAFREEDILKLTSIKPTNKSR